MTDIQETINNYARRFNARLEKLFTGGSRPEEKTANAMLYSLMNGGKRLRPFLVAETAALFGKGFDESFAAAAALEMVHTYSLIHDDLPAMDNDDLRRGKPSCHKQFDEATAILAGDGLLTQAFGVLAVAVYADDVKIGLIRLLAQRAGAFGGMIAGQTLDLYAETLNSGKAEASLIYRIEEMKTGQLLQYACEAGALIGGADHKAAEALITYSRKLGMAFQIADDILDVEGNQERVGKTLKKDQGQNKMTFVSLLGLEQAKKLAASLAEEAKDALAAFGAKSQTLCALADFTVNRDH